jgi:hypothetical protein
MEATARHHYYSKLPDVPCRSDKWSIQNGSHKKELHFTFGFKVLRELKYLEQSRCLYKNFKPAHSCRLI